MEVPGNGTGEGVTLPAALALLDAKATSVRVEGGGVYFVGQIKIMAPGQYNLGQIATWEVDYDVHITGAASGIENVELLLPKSVAWTLAADNNVTYTTSFPSGPSQLFHVQ